MASTEGEVGVTQLSFDELAEGIGTPPTLALDNGLAPGSGMVPGAENADAVAEVSAEATDADRERRLQEVQRVLRSIERAQGRYLPEGFDDGEIPEDDEGADEVADGMVLDYGGVLSGAESTFLGWDAGVLSSKAEVERDLLIVGLRNETEKLLAEASSQKAERARLAAEKDIAEAESAGCREEMVALQKELGERDRRQQKLALDLARLTAALEVQAGNLRDKSRDAKLERLLEEGRSDAADQLKFIVVKQMQAKKAYEEALSEVRTLKKTIRLQQVDFGVREEELHEKVARRNEDIQMLLASNQQLAAEKQSYVMSEQLAREFAEYCTTSWGEEKVLREQAEDSVAELTEKVEQLQARLVKEQGALQELRRERMAREDEVRKKMADVEAEMAALARSKGVDAAQMLRSAAGSWEAESMRAEANRWRIEKEKLELDLADLAGELEEQGMQWQAEKRELLGQLEAANTKLLQMEAQQNEHAGFHDVSIMDDHAWEWGEFPLSEERQRRLLLDLKASKDLLARTEHIHAEASANFQLVSAYASEGPGGVNRVLLEEATRLRKELASAQAAGDARQQELEKARQGRSTLEAERQGLVADVRALREEAQKAADLLQAQKDSFEAQLSGLAEQLQCAEDEARRKGEELTSTSARLKELQREQADLSARLEESCSEAESQQAQASRAEDRLNELQERVSQLESEAETDKAEADRLTGELQKARVDCGTWESRAEELGRAVEAARDDLEDVQGKLVDEEAERGRLQQELELKEAEGRRAAEQVRESQEKVLEITEALGGLQVEKEDLERRLAEAVHSLAAGQAALHEAEARIKDSEQRLAGALAEQEQLSSRAQLLVQELASAAQSQQAGEEARTRLQAELEEAQGAAEAVARLEGELRSSQGRCEEESSRADAAETKAVEALATVREREETIQKLKLEIEGSEALREQLRASEQQLGSAQEDSDRLAGKVSDLEKSMASATEAMAQLRESLADAQAAASTSEATKEALADAEARIKDQAKQLLEADAEKLRLQGTVSELQASLSARVEEAHGALAQVQKVEGSLAQQKEVADALTAEKESLLHELADAKSRASEVAAEHKQQLAKAQARADELGASLDALRPEYSEKAAAVEALTEKVTHLEAAMGAAEQALGKARAEGQAESAKWAAEMQGKEALCAQLQARSRALEEELGEAELGLAAELSACAELELDKASLESDSQVLHLRLGELQTEVQQRQRELEERAGVLRELEAECERQRGVIRLQEEAARRAVGDAQGDAEHSRALLCQLQGELAQSRAAVQAKEGVMAELEREKGALMRRLQEGEELLLKERDESATALASLQSQLDAAQVECADLELRCETAEESLEAAESALREGEQSLEHLRDELSRKESLWVQASKERGAEEAVLRSQLAAAEKGASEARAESRVLEARLEEAQEKLARADKGPPGPGQWVKAETAAAELRGAEGRLRAEVEAERKRREAVEQQVQQLTGALEKAKAELAAKQARLAEAEELGRRLQGEVRSLQQAAERATTAASKASKDAEAAKQKQQEREKKQQENEKLQRQALEQAKQEGEKKAAEVKQEGEKKAAEVEARLRKELSQLASAKEAELKTLSSALAAREKEWAGKDKAWTQAEKQRAAAEIDLRKELERERKEGRKKDAEAQRRQEELRKKEGEWAKKVEELSSELGRERKSRGRVRDLESALEAAKKAEKAMGAKLQAAEEKASRLKAHNSQGAPSLGDLARLEAVLNTVEEKAAKLEVLVQRKEDENAELRQEMRAVAEQIAEEKAGRAAALRKLMSSIPLQADSSSDDGSERQLAGHQFAAHSAGLEDMEARARVLGNMGAPAEQQGAQRALGAAPLMGRGGWTVREVTATDSNVSSDADHLSRAPSELGLATPGAAGTREHAGGAAQPDGDHGSYGWEGQEPVGNGYQGGFSGNVIFPHELNGTVATGRRRQKYMVDAIFLDNLRREREDLVMQLEEYRGRTEAFEMICAENTWLQAAVLQLADDNKLLSLKIENSQRQVASYEDIR